VLAAAVHAAALLVLLAVRPGAEHGAGRDVWAAAAIVGVAVAAAGTLVYWLGWRRQRPDGRIRADLAALGGVLRQPRRAVLLWSGATAIPTLHVLTLIAVLRGLGQPTPVVTVAVAYLGASALAAAVPGPGGFGALDVALIAALTGSGLAASAALAGVIGYRLLTGWLPLVPGAAMLLLLLHHRVI
jgi:putative heme transporter